MSRNGNCNLVFIACPVSLAGVATSIIFVATKDVFCRDKNMLVAKTRLSRQTFFGRDKTYFCRDKHTKHVFCRDKSMLVETNMHPFFFFFFFLFLCGQNDACDSSPLMIVLNVNCDLTQNVQNVNGNLLLIRCHKHQLQFGIHKMP